MPLPMIRREGMGVPCLFADSLKLGQQHSFYERNFDTSVGDAFLEKGANHSLNAPDVAQGIQGFFKVPKRRQKSQFLLLTVRVRG
jgi:hypothetical protein